jgi:hypothetical protein
MLLMSECMEEKTEVKEVRSQNTTLGVWQVQVADMEERTKEDARCVWEV